MKTKQKLEKYIIYLDELLREIAWELGDEEDLDHALKALTTVLTAIRKRLPFETSIRFFNLLPLPVKAIYMDNWIVSERMPERLAGMDDLLEEMEAFNPEFFTPFYGDREAARRTVKAIFRAISMHMLPSDLEAELRFFPEDIQTYLKSHQVENQMTSVDSCIWFS